MIKRASFLAVVLLLHATGIVAAPDEELLGKSKGYPVGNLTTWFYEEPVRVGSFTHLEQIAPHRVLEKPATPLKLAQAANVPSFRYEFRGRSNSIDDYLAHQRAMGLLVIKDGEILVERYQYDRKVTDKFVSHSMAKSLTSLAVGFALQEGKIASLDDKISRYVPELAGSLYGDTAIRHVLRMSSGVKFVEKYDGKDDLARFGGLVNSQGVIAALRAFDERDAAAGQRFHYASSETTMLGLLVRAATGQNLSDYLDERLWKPMGAEADASWTIDKQGVERAAGGFNAILRDYGRLGVLLANDGALNGRQILPKEYLLEATDWHRQPEAFAPGRATPTIGYGYQFWLLPGEKRRFGLIGVYGQAIYVDPSLKLVLVHTAAAKTASIAREEMGQELRALWTGLVKHYGPW
jgi:CubicO group peptidase (beta-lactamase class C family)